MEIQLLINEYLKDKAKLRDIENDSLNVADNQIVSWNFKNIKQPTTEELEALVEAVKEKTEQTKINEDAIKYLADTDWMLLRELDGGDKMSDDVKKTRADARFKVSRSLKD